MRALALTRRRLLARAQERDKQIWLDERRERLADTLRRLAARESKLALHYRDSAHEHKGRARRILKKIESLQLPLLAGGGGGGGGGEEDDDDDEEEDEGDDDESPAVPSVSARASPKARASPSERHAGEGVGFRPSWGGGGSGGGGGGGAPDSSHGGGSPQPRATSARAALGGASPGHTGRHVGAGAAVAAATADASEAEEYFGDEDDLTGDFRNDADLLQLLGMAGKPHRK